jgi:hypothetical protein
MQILCLAALSSLKKKRTSSELFGFLAQPPVAQGSVGVEWMVLIAVWSGLGPVGALTVVTI